MPVEALGVAASIIAIVQISKTIISICNFYIEGVDDAPSDLRVILIEISALKAIAKSLHRLTQLKAVGPKFSNQLADITGPIDGCRKALKDLESLFPSNAVPANGRNAKRRKLNNALAALAWPLRAGKAKRLLQEIMQHKSTITLALTAEFVADVKDVKQTTEEIQSTITEVQIASLHEWLVTTNPSDIHARSQRLYEPGTACWILRTPEWPLFIDGKHRCLWIHGIPGAGKSILASYLAKELEKHSESRRQCNSLVGHAYYYCYFGHNQDESWPFLRWIISQLCRQANNTPKELRAEYKSGKAPTLTSLLSILHTILGSFERAYIVLDAVDESIPRDDLLRVIRDLAQDVRFSNLSLVVTSREYIDIEQVMEIFSTQIAMSNPVVEEDIRMLVRSRIQSEVKYQKWPVDLRSELIDLIPNKAKGMFRWAACQLECLKRLKPDATTIRKALLNLPKTLDETYERIVLEIPEEDRVTVQHAFHWIACHETYFDQRISVPTLLQAVKKSTEGFLSPGSDDLHDFDGLRERCGCLIIVEEEEKSKSRTRRTVSFAHYTVKEYLQSSRICAKEVGFLALGQRRVWGHLTAIAFDQALAIKPHQVARLTGNPYGSTLQVLRDEFFELYCVEYSMYSLEFSAEEISLDSNLMDLCEAFVDPSGPAWAQISAYLRIWDTFFGFSDRYTNSAYWDLDWHRCPDSEAAIFFNLLLAAGESDIPHLARGFANRHSMFSVFTQKLEFPYPECWSHDTNDNARFEFVGTIPEAVAQWTLWRPEAFTLVLELISRFGVNHFDLTPLLLFHSGSHCHSDCCKNSCSLEMLLHMGANPAGPDGTYATPLQVAVYCLDLQAVKLLLDAGADPSSIGADGSEWGREDYMSRFNHLHEFRPLHIIRNLVLEDVSLRSHQKGIERDIELCLLEAGAVDESETRVE